MTDKTNPFAVEAPPPLWRWEGEYKEATSNLDAIQMHNQHGSLRMILDRATAKKYQRMLDKLDALLEKHGAYDLLQAHDDLREEFAALRTLNYELLKAVEETDAPQTLRETKSEIAIVRENAKSIKDDIAAAAERLRPFRKYFQMKRKLEHRLDEHALGLKDKAINEENSRKLVKEAHMVEEVLIQVLNGREFMHKEHNGKKSIIHSIKFERRIVTPDTIQFKVKYLTRGLFGGTVYHTPQTVDVIKAMMTPTLLAQMSAALEMIVTCPQAESGRWNEGTWILVQRNGMISGLPEMVRYKEFMQMYKTDDRTLLPVPGGVRQGLWATWIKLAKQPHILVSGTTGSGKSNTINALICTLITRNSPEEVRMILCDFKEMAEFGSYEGIPHLIGPPIGEPDRCAQVMVALENERARRMKELRLAGARDINTYNERHPDHKMPHIVIIFDEFGALTYSGFKEQAKVIYDVAAQLAMKARAAGIHMIIGVQTTSSEYIPRAVRDNITTRMAGKQQNMYSSIGATGSKAAADLPDVKGRFLVDYLSEFYQVQMPFITEEEITDAIKQSKEYEAPYIDAVAFGFSDGPVEDALELPQTLVKKTFGRDEFIAMCLERLDGAINYTRIWEIIKNDPEYDVRFRDLKRIAGAIREQPTLEFEGVTYELAANGGGKRLQVITLDDTSTDETSSIYVEEDVENNVESEMLTEEAV